jgi:hypothetical protein
MEGLSISVRACAKPGFVRFIDRENPQFERTLKKRGKYADNEEP